MPPIIAEDAEITAITIAVFVSRSGILYHFQNYLYFFLCISQRTKTSQRRHSRTTQND